MDAGLMWCACMNAPTVRDLGDHDVESFLESMVHRHLHCLDPAQHLPCTPPITLNDSDNNIDLMRPSTTTTTATATERALRSRRSKRRFTRTHAPRCCLGSGACAGAPR
eukprot:803832-Rhodomonas_salina.1